MLLWGRKQTGTLLCLWSLAHILTSLASHDRAAQSTPRDLAVIFPLLMILASLRTNSVAFVITVVVLSLLQAATSAMWTLGWGVAMSHQGQACGAMRPWGVTRTGQESRHERAAP